MMKYIVPTIEFLLFETADIITWSDDKGYDIFDPIPNPDDGGDDIFTPIG